jgi:signal transduction histidine kinase
LKRFMTAGVDENLEAEIGAPPHGHGVLGELIRDPRPLRLAEVGDHPYFFGFPRGHPVMHTFLGVPIPIAGQPYGNLYLAEKHDRQQFTAHDEEALVALSEFAGLAIDHARRYSQSEARRGELQRTVEALDATVQISRALAGETDLNKVLELVAKRGRALIGARTLVIQLSHPDDLIIGAVAGEASPSLIGARLQRKNTVAGAAMLTFATQRLEDEHNRRHFEQYDLGQFGLSAGGGLVVPLKLRGRAYGALTAIDRLAHGPSFSAQDKRLLEWFAGSAATALVTALAVSAERERERVAAAEEERARWAREIHEGTLQRLAGVQLALASARRASNPTALDETVAKSIDELRSEITTLRSLSFELRPTALDELGIKSAITALAAHTERHGITVALRVELIDEHGPETGPRPAELETAIYRIVQEALHNIQQHANATHAAITVRQSATTVELIIRDDGTGFDPAEIAERFGLVGIRERIELLTGELTIDSAPGKGTTIRASLPAPKRLTRALDHEHAGGDPAPHAPRHTHRQQ